MDSPQRFYFLGEFGVFTQLVIGAFEAYFEKYPDVRVEILTFNDYGDILSLLFPANIKKILPYNGPNLYSFRFGIGLAGEYPRIIDTMVTGMDDISGIVANLGYRGPLYFPRQRKPGSSLASSILKGAISYVKWRMSSADESFFPVLPISRPITFGQKNAEKRYVCLLPRRRSHKNSNSRNCGPAFWDWLISNILLPEFSEKVQFVLCGLKAEEEDFSPKSSFIRPKDIYEEINFLNNSILVICPLSGYGQFASYCGANVLYVMPDKPIFQEQKHLSTVKASNIFGKTVKLYRQARLKEDPCQVIAEIDFYINSSGRPSAPLR